MAGIRPLSNDPDLIGYVSKDNDTFGFIGYDRRDIFFPYSNLIDRDIPSRILFKTVIFETRRSERKKGSEAFNIRFVDKHRDLNFLLKLFFDYILCKKDSSNIGASLSNEILTAINSIKPDRGLLRQTILLEFEKLKHREELQRNDRVFVYLCAQHWKATDFFYTLRKIDELNYLEYIQIAKETYSKKDWWHYEIEKYGLTYISSFEYCTSLIKKNDTTEFCYFFEHKTSGEERFKIASKLRSQKVEDINVNKLIKDLFENYAEVLNDGKTEFNVKLIDKKTEIKHSKSDSSPDTEEKRTFENYNGTHAQDQEGYSDQDIDDIFGGDPDAYWNID